MTAQAAADRAHERIDSLLGRTKAEIAHEAIDSLLDRLDHEQAQRERRMRELEDSRRNARRLALRKLPSWFERLFTGGPWGCCHVAA